MIALMPGADQCQARAPSILCQHRNSLFECFNVFHVLRYDIKGCEVSRWTEPAPVGSQIIVVLKDLNFEGQYINLGKERELNSRMCRGII